MESLVKPGLNAHKNPSKSCEETEPCERKSDVVEKGEASMPTFIPLWVLNVINQVSEELPGGDTARKASLNGKCLGSSSFTSNGR